MIEARELAPADAIPRVALAALYHDTLLEAEELEQRRLAVELVDKKFKAELDLDYAFSLAQAGEGKAAGDAARRVIITEGAQGVRFRAWILLGQLALDAGNEGEAVAAALEARKEAPTERGPIKFAARLAAALQNPEPLLPLFEDVLAKQEDPDSRFFALFGAWTTSTKLAIVLGKDADGPVAHGYWVRLRDLDPGQLDALSRRYQVISLLPAHKEETDALRRILEEMKAGMPPIPGTLSDLARFWRASDCVLLSAARPCLQEVAILEKRWPVRDVMLLKASALLGARQDEALLLQLALLKLDYKAEMPELRYMRWLAQVRQGHAKEVLREIDAMPQDAKTDNATLFMQAITRFRTYRKAGTAGGK
jgi:hypothetical protein